MSIAVEGNRELWDAQQKSLAWRGDGSQLRGDKGRTLPVEEQEGPSGPAESLLLSSSLSAWA